MKVRFVIWTLLMATPVLTGCIATTGHNLPPAERLMHPGPGVGGPGPGVVMPHGGNYSGIYNGGGGRVVGAGVVAAGGMGAGGGVVTAGGGAAMGGGGVIQTGGMGGPACIDDGAGGGAGGGGLLGGNAQILFSKPESMQVQWDVGSVGMFDSQVLITPGRQNFAQGGIYRLKLTGIAGREGVELYPTLAIYPATPRSATFLAHNAIPVQFTDQDLDQVLAGNFVTKAVYIPDPEFQELAVGVDTLVSSPVDPGLDPVVEADRRGSILAVIRLGNRDLETPGQQTQGGTIQASYQAAAGQRPAVSPAAFAAAGTAYPSPAPQVDGGYAVDGGYVDGGYVDGGYVDGGYVDGGYVDGGHVEGGYVGGGHVNGGCMDGNCGPGAAYGGDGLGGGVNGTYGGGAGTYDPGPGGMPAGLMLSGQYGMTTSGTPIGLPGPPHIPLGVPAGLQKHVMKNWTRRHIPDPTEKIKINVKQRPGLSYPVPASRAWVTEDTIQPNIHYGKHNGLHGGLMSCIGGLKGMFHGGGGKACATCP